MIIAIDGPAGSGKSTIANILASRFGYNKRIRVPCTARSPSSAPTMAST